MRDERASLNSARAGCSRAGARFLGLDFRFRSYEESATRNPVPANSNHFDLLNHLPGTRSQR
jgi:hypothetical protein